MKQYYWLSAAICIVGFCIYYSTARYGSATSTINPPFCVVCTTTMLADTVRILSGNSDDINIITIMGPGVDPHLYRAREGDVHRIANANLVLYHGLHLEGKLGDLFAGMQAYVPTVPITEIINPAKLRGSGFAGIYDPHVWHDVALWIACVENVRDALMEYNPDCAQEYAKNAAVYIDELHNLDRWIHEQIKTIPQTQRILITAHDAFAYFGKAYGLEVLGLQGISTESEIGTKDIIDMVKHIIENRIPVMFVESSVPTRAAQAVQQAVAAAGWSIVLGEELYSDSLGDKKSGADTYVHMMHHNVCAIVSGLSRDPQKPAY
jgi:manganese/zinc/iron transport system substrate-binding protein